MRENKRVLKLKKFKVANLQITGIVGGTDTNPCHMSTEPACGTQAEEGQQGTSYPNECTVFHGRTDLKNGCTDPDSAITTEPGCQQVSG